MSFHARLALFPVLASLALPATYSSTQAATFLKQYCAACHQGPKPTAKFAALPAGKMSGPAQRPDAWLRVLARVRDHEMPPRQAPQPSLDAREQFLEWSESGLKKSACASGLVPGPAPLRRLTRSQYSATVRDLLNIHISAGRDLPDEGAGGEGFDNAAETLFLSPIHAEKYLDAAKQALEYAFSDPRSRGAFLAPLPSAPLSEDDAARAVFSTFVPRAFRRPATQAELDRYFHLYSSARRRGEDWENGIRHAMEGILISPHFLFRIEPANTTASPRPLDDYALASRLSYFLWNSMPDANLFTVASTGVLSDPHVLAGQASCMLADQRTLAFTENFVEQWLGTRELGRDIKPDAAKFPEFYDEEVQSAIKYEPIIFFQEVLANNLSLLTLIDSDFTILTNKLQRHYGVKITQRLRQQPVRVTLPADSRRGGLLSMAAILALSSYPHRTSPVLRGKWVLESMLGTPPPPPPSDVPKLDENTNTAAPATVRERLEIHRRNPACTSCHERMDPIGFALENYDVLGRWRDSDSNKPIDAMGRFPDGAVFTGPDELKKVMLERKSQFVKHLTSKMLGYALGRGLTLADQCTVDAIAAKVEAQNYSSQTLIREIVSSVPFRFQQGVLSR